MNNNSIAFFKTPKELVKIMLSNVELDNNTKILDTGFGQMAFLKEIYLQENLKKENIFGVEYSSIFFEKAKNELININLFNQDYLSFEENNFDVIIGNPPYIHSKNLDTNMKSKVKELVGYNESNLYYAFILKSIELLKEGGSLSYILPYDFFHNTYAKELRNKMVLEGSFEYIIDFKELNIFKGASPDTIIFKWVKGVKNKEIKVISLEQKISYKDSLYYLEDVLFKEKSNEIYSFRYIKAFKENSLFYLNEYNFKSKTIKIKELAKVSVGIVSGADELFKVKNKDKINKEEYKYIKPFVKNKHLINNFCKETEDYFFFRNNDFVNEDDFKLKAPSIFREFLISKDILLNRYLPKGKWWFEYLAIRNLNEIENNINKYKLLVPNITRKDNKWFSITNKECYIGGDLIMLSSDKEDNIFFLYGLLNSESFCNYYKLTGPKKGNRILFTQKTLEEFNIPLLDKDLYNRIVILARNNKLEEINSLLDRNF